MDGRVTSVTVCLVIMEDPALPGLMATLVDAQLAFKATTARKTSMSVTLPHVQMEDFALMILVRYLYV